MRLALCIQTPEYEARVPTALLAGSFQEKLAKAARLHYEGVELMAVEPAKLDAAAVQSGLMAEDLEVAAVASGAIPFTTGLTLLHPDAAAAAEAERRLHDLIRLAATLGAPVVTVGSFRGRLSAGNGDGRGRLAALLREAGTAAAESDVRLVIEPLNRYETDLINNTAQGLRFLDEVAHPAVGLLLDTYHMNIEESSWVAPLQSAMAAGRLWHLHLGDNNRLPPGRGMIDFQAIVNTLRTLGYTGYLSAELLALPDPDTAASLIAAHMRPILAS
jgi:sugar phosphate isomerase/epimerase